MDPQYVYNTYDMDTTHKYTPGNIIGEGAFGNVRIGKHNSTGTNVAMKYVKVVARERIIPKAVFREIEALRQLSACRSIVKLYDVFAHETNICLVFEYLETDLGEIISCAKQHFPLQYIKTYIHMMLEPVCYCHKHNIIHRDIKPSNILVNSMGQLKLADFGLARVLPKACTSLETNNVGVIDNDAQFRCESLSHQVATRWYRAPELLFASRHYDFAVDMWALGAIFGDLYSLQPLFPGHNDIDQINKVFQIMGTPNETYWPVSCVNNVMHKWQFLPFLKINLQICIYRTRKNYQISRKSCFLIWNQWIFNFCFLICLKVTLSSSKSF